MKLRLTVTYIFTFLLLLIVMLEFHEIVHITVGRIICGCWGTRDFNVWSLCEACMHPSMGWLTTLSGPVFSFGMMWLGWYWLRSANKHLNQVGFALIFANIPFGRITGIMMGGGDEMMVLRRLLGDTFSRTSLIIGGSVLMFLIVAPPVLKAYRAISNKYAWIYILGFLTVPLAFLLLYVLTFLNGLITKGIMASPWIMGTPLLITIHTLLAAGLFAFTWRNLTGHKTS